MISKKLKVCYLVAEAMPEPDASGAVHAFQCALSMT
jgi:hypothetical protein